MIHLQCGVYRYKVISTVVDRSAIVIAIVVYRYKVISTVVDLCSPDSLPPGL